MKYLNMRNIGMYTLAIMFSTMLFFSTSSCTQNKKTESFLSLKNGIGTDFLIGVAVNTNETSGLDTLGAALIARQFNSIVPENCMKCAEIHPEENRFSWESADQYVDFGVKHHMFIIGHCLIWHSQLAPWFCVDSIGRDVSPSVLKQRMKFHISTIVSRYKGRVKGWDVVNEALLDDGSYRNSKFYQILGEEFIPYAFKCAHEADPQAELYYNDYSLFLPSKQQGVLHIVKSIRDYGAMITGIGMQSHFTMDGPSISQVQTAIDTLSSTGCKLMITEFDLSVLPFPNDINGAGIEQTEKYSIQYNPYTKSLPDSIEQVWSTHMKDYFDLYRSNKSKIERVTIWGLTDKSSWRNDWPILGRTDYPTLFNRDYTAKQFTKTLMR